MFRRQAMVIVLGFILVSVVFLVALKRDLDRGLKGGWTRAATREDGPSAIRSGWA